MSLFSALAGTQRKRLGSVRQLYQEDRKAKTPAARGMRLLKAWLSTEQRMAFERFGYFDVIGSVTGKTYRIYPGRYANVHELGENGLPREGWCFVPDGNLVPGDIMLAQKIALETAECATLAIANKFPPSLTILRSHR